MNGFKSGDFARLKDGSLVRAYSAQCVEMLDGSLLRVDYSELQPVKYSPDYSQLVNATFDSARRLAFLEGK